jgi:hypothetical protein
MFLALSDLIFLPRDWLKFLLCLLPPFTGFFSSFFSDLNKEVIEDNKPPDFLGRLGGLVTFTNGLALEGEDDDSRQSIFGSGVDGDKSNEYLALVSLFLTLTTL